MGTLDISGTLTNLVGALPTGQQVLQNVLLGAGTTVILSGLKSADGQNALDPLHLIFKPAPAPAAAPSTAVVAPVPTATQAAFNAMTPAAQVQFLQLGGHIAG